MAGIQKYKDSNRRNYYDETIRLFRSHVPEVVDDGTRPQFDDYLPLLGQEFSFEQGLTGSQIRWLKTSAIVVSAATFIAPVFVLAVLSVLFFAIFTVLIIWRLGLVLVGASLRLASNKQNSQTNNDLPVYSILVPVYQEAPIMKQLAQALKKLDWPKARLDIQLLIEADDPETLRAAKKARFSKQTRFTIIPPGGPRTKPNALNFGLMQARGQYVCVYDAEDRPDPSQLKAAYCMFKKSKGDLACVQAPLIGDNAGSALIAAHWSLEYAVQFGLIMPAMASSDLPLLIGGTSNHFRKDVLLASGGWDGFNVTEDADLGMRLARANMRTKMITPPTYEDAPEHISVWVPQRSRWIKGFMQTWLVLMRRPSHTRRQMGGRDFAVMQLSLGGAVLAPLLHLPLFLLVLAALISSSFSLGFMGTSLLVAGLLVGLLGDVCAPGAWSFSRVAAVLTRPLYWPLHSIAAYRALWELAVKPHFWAKTPHKPRHEEPEDFCGTGLSA